jgi:hypothetical protein
MVEDKLPPLPGTVRDETWKIGTADRDEANGGLAIFAVVARTTSELNLAGLGHQKLPGLNTHRLFHPDYSRGDYRFQGYFNCACVPQFVAHASRLHQCTILEMIFPR